MKCEVCGKKDFRTIQLKKTVFRCKNCGFLFSNPDFKYDFHSGVNAEAMEDSLKNLRAENAKIILRLIKNFFREKKIVGLEVGSSYGWFLGAAKKAKIICDGIEPEEKTYRRSLETGQKVIKGFFPAALENKKQYDFIIFNDTFEHIPNLNQSFKIVRQNLKNNGLLIINLPLSTGFFYRTANILNYLGVKSYLNRLWQFDFHSPHFYYFDKKNLTQFFKKHRFKLWCYLRMKTFSDGTVQERLEIDKKNTSKTLSTLISPIVPLLKFFPEDIGCFFAVKLDK